MGPQEIKNDVTPTLRIINAGDKGALNRWLAPAGRADRAFDRRVRAIVDRVREGGDRALARFARRFDRATPPFEIGLDQMRAGAALVPADVRRAIRLAARNIARVAFRQIPKHWDLEVAPGVLVEQRVEPLARVGCYVPGGRFPLPSSLLMTAVPARVAGVREIIVVCPRPEPAVMAAALEAGVTRLFRIGGAHAIAALAYGTETIPRVDKIVGPGNRYVAAAKASVAADCAIDFFAGPTEIVIVAGTGRPAWIAADLVAQAEHDPDARSIFSDVEPGPGQTGRSGGGPSGRGARRRRAIACRQRRRDRHADRRRSDGAGEPPRARTSRGRPRGAGAARHRRRRAVRRAVRAQAAGDYATGSNHVLPTAGAARFRGGLSAADFVRVMSVQRLTRAGLARLAPAILPLARAEGLEAHAASIEVRLR